MKKSILISFILGLFCLSVNAQTLTISTSSAGNVLVKRGSTTLVNVIPNYYTVCDTKRVAGYTYVNVRFKSGNTVLSTVKYGPTQDSIAGLTAWEFTNYMNLQYMVNRPAGQFWRIPSSTRTSLPGTSFCPQIIQVEDTDSAKVMTRSPAGIWKSAILD